MHRPPTTSTLFPYTTLFRSILGLAIAIKVTQNGNISMTANLSPPKKISVVLADDHTIVRQGLRLLLESADDIRSEEHTSELQSRRDLVCRLLLEKKKNKNNT